MTISNTPDSNAPGSNTIGRYYLNGIDWVMAALDRLNIVQTGLGTHSQLVLVLRGYLDREKFARQLSVILSKNMFLRGKTRRAWNLAPYWVPEKTIFNAKDVRFFKLESENQTKDKNLDLILQSCATTAFKDNKTLLGFDLIHCNHHSYLIMRFSHRIFDARGAEALLEYILDENNLDKECKLPYQGVQLDSWKEKFLSGQCINRFLRSLYSKNDVAAQIHSTKTNDPDDGITRISCKSQSMENLKAGSQHNFCYTAFSEGQSLAIDDNAVKQAGYLMNGIFFLSCAAKSFDSLLKKYKKPGNILIPINVDLRKTRFSMDKLFFNKVSFMLFKVKQGLKTADYIVSLKAQFLDQVKNKIPYHFINASLLMRIMPLKLLTMFMKFRMNKQPCSFSFSYIAEQAFNLSYVQDHEVVNLFHMPLVPVNPGIGIFFTRFNKKLNMVISNFNHSLEKKDCKYLHEKIISKMIPGQGNEEV